MKFRLFPLSPKARRRRVHIYTYGLLTIYFSKPLYDFLFRDIVERYRQGTNEQTSDSFVLNQRSAKDLKLGNIPMVLDTGKPKLARDPDDEKSTELNANGRLVGLLHLSL